MLLYHFLKDGKVHPRPSENRSHYLSSDGTVVKPNFSPFQLTNNSHPVTSDFSNYQSAKMSPAYKQHPAFPSCVLRNGKETINRPYIRQRMVSQLPQPSLGNSCLRQASFSELSPIIDQLNLARFVSHEARNALSNQSLIAKMMYVLYCKQGERWKRLEICMDNRPVPIRNRSKVNLAMEKLDRALAVEAYWRREEMEVRAMLNGEANTRDHVQLDETCMLEQIESMRLNGMAKNASTRLHEQLFSPDEIAHERNVIEVHDRKEQSSTLGTACSSCSNRQTDPIKFMKMRLAEMLCLPYRGSRKIN